MALAMRFPQGLKCLAVNLPGGKRAWIERPKMPPAGRQKRARSLRLRVSTACDGQNADGYPHAPTRDADFSPCQHTAAPRLRRKFRCFHTGDRDRRAHGSRARFWCGSSLTLGCPFSYPSSLYPDIPLPPFHEPSHGKGAEMGAKSCL